MLDSNTRLTILHDDNGVFIGHSDSLLDYGRDTSGIVLTSAEDKLMIGFEKPINAVYPEMDTANTNANTLTLKYYDGASFIAVSDFLDESKGFTRSGFITWTRPVDPTTYETLEIKTSINSIEKFWYEISTDVDFSAGTIFRGLNLVFADDQDIKKEIPELVSDTRYLPSGESSHILLHSASRDELIQWLRRQQYTKKTEGERDFKDINQWDLLNSAQLRKTATYLAISRLYLDQLSDAPEDVYEIKGQRFRNKYKDARNLYLIEIDADNDGVLDSDETISRPQTVVLGR